ncbi:MAG TPA: methyltransferase domain-containing protein [Anaeromyxobacter sp.]
MTGSEHDRDLARAFDVQAAAFERAKVQRDAESLSRFVGFAAVPRGGRVLDAGCGPGLVAEAFLEAGCDVLGVDLSAEMIRRAQARCARFGERARFEQRSLFDLSPGQPLDAALSRNVIHHLEDPQAFVARQAALVRPGGAVLVLDLSGEPDPAGQAFSQGIERDRDRTHVRTLTPGEMVDMLIRAGLEDLRLAEEHLVLDFDEWFDRGTPAAPKEAVRARLVAGRAQRFVPSPRPDGRVDIRVTRTMVRATKPA